MKRYDTYIETNTSWLPVIPADWAMIKLKHICLMRAGKNLTSEQTSDYGRYPVYGGNGIRGYYSESNFSGDCCIVGRQGALCGNVHRAKGELWATEHAVLCVPKADVSLDYLYYLLTAMNLNQYSSDTAAQPGLAVSSIVMLKGCIPPQVEQNQIVRYLDWQVSKINLLIAAKKQEIALFEESKVNHIANAVLHGVRHHEHCIETTEFGSIPAHWQVIQNKRLFCERVEHSETGTETLLSVSKHYGVKPSAELTEDEQFATIKPALSLIGYKAVCKNDLVMNIMRARNGSYGISDYDGIVSPAYCIYYTTKECNVKYLHYFLRTPHVKSLFEAYSSGIAEHRRRLYPEDFLRLKSVLPPIEEQNEIVEHIELAIVKYDAGIANLRQQIACLQDMKTRLISDAVTGQVDVRDIEVPEYEVVEDTDTREEPEEDTEGEEYEE